MVEPLRTDQLEVEINYGQVYVYSRAPWLVEDGRDAVLEALDDARRSDRWVGMAHGLVDLVSPVQTNFAAPMGLEVWQGEPPDDGVNWDHVVDVDLDVVDDRLHFEGSGGRPAIVVAVPSGRYRARFAGRGYDLGRREQVAGMDEYRVQLWARDADGPPVLRRRWAGWDRYG